MKTRPRRSSATKSIQRTKTARYSKPNRSFGGPGLHNRRDKRFPNFKQRIAADSDESASDDADVGDQEMLSTAEATSWREAVMLWLSWNQTHERLVAKMCRSDQCPEKIAAMQDEMEALREQAIDLSEELIQAV